MVGQQAKGGMHLQVLRLVVFYCIAVMGNEEESIKEIAPSNTGQVLLIKC